MWLNRGTEWRLRAERVVGRGQTMQGLGASEWLGLTEGLSRGGTGSESSFHGILLAIIGESGCREETTTGVQVSGEVTCPLPHTLSPATSF